MNEKLTLREFEPGDEAAILAARGRAFGAVDPGFTRLSPERWRWQYLANPAGARVTLALDEAGEVLAQYAGQSRHVSFDGERLRTSHAADSFVVSEARGLSRRGVFVRTGEVFAATYGGASAEHDRWMWGFPSPAALRIGARSLGYRAIREQPWLVRPADAPALAGEAAGRAQSVGSEHDAFFAARASALGVVGVRDAAYLRWRYLEHPDHEYVQLEARGATGELEGLAFGRSLRLAGREVWCLAEWLATPAAWPALVAGAVREAAGLELVLVLSPTCADFEGLQELDFRVRRSPWFLVGRSYDRRYPHEAWAERWYLTLGDTDLV